MVFLHFPSNLTDEELMLQAKYTKLRKKKKALEQMKVPKQEPERINPLKRQLDPKDAKELAKKMILSGKISLPVKQAVEKTVFKRPRTLERKMLATGRSEGHGGLTPGYNANFSQNDYQFEPFTPAPLDSSTSAIDKSSPNKFASKTPVNTTPSPPKPKSIHKSPKSSLKDSNETYGSNERSSPKGQNKPKRGPTIYVQAHNITDEILREQFGKFGKIVNVKLNNPAVGFVTFDKVECADVAVQEMNGGTFDDISYDVQFARRQPNITQLINDASASASWTAIATSHSQKSSHQDRRAQVVYDEPMET